jgi:hypothetical protein
MSVADAAAQVIAERQERDRLAGIAFEGDYEARIIIDLDGTIKNANKRARLITAHPDLIGKNFRILLPARFAKGHDTHFAGFKNDPRARPMGFGSDLFMMDGTGTEKKVELSLNPLEDPDGGPMKICIGIVVPKPTGGNITTTTTVEITEADKR